MEETDEFSLDISKVNTSLNSALIEDVNFSVDMSVEREQELRNLLKSIEELNTIFKDIAILVVEQGSVLDRIDYNIQNAEVNIIHADEEIKKVIFKNRNIIFLFCINGKNRVWKKPKHPEQNYV